MSKKDDLNFEDVLKNLEEITNKLEKEQLSLDETVNLFEKGTELSKKCNEILENAEKRISILIKTEDGITEENY